MNEEEKSDLFDKYYQGECTPEEVIKIESWFLQHEGPSKTYGDTRTLKAAGKRVWAKLDTQFERKRQFPILRYAASILLVVGITWGTYHTFLQKTATKDTISAADIKPGGNVATLTLANGKIIKLDSTSNATLSIGSTQISNNAYAGTVTFKEQNGETKGKQVLDRYTNSEGFNTVVTPSGGQYSLILPDGTHVFLNALSRLTFSSSFTGLAKREVTLVGEAYFEVTKDPKKPFQVNTGQQQLTVLGTHFNISAYPSETIKTTLAEGSVKLQIPSSNLTQILSPNQQSELLSSRFNVKTVNVDDEIAWIKGNFVFRQTPIRTALQQISRWYDVEIDYTNLPNTVLDAILPRSYTLADVLEGIEISSGVKIQLTNERRLKFIK
jgi:transmembrane sensor